MAAEWHWWVHTVGDRFRAPVGDHECRQGKILFADDTKLPLLKNLVCFLFCVVKVGTS